MSNSISRRNFLRSSALATAALSTTASLTPLADAQAKPTAPSFKLGLASYTFRNFTRAQLIGYMKQLQLTDLNVKDVKDHLPMPALGADPAAENAALADYATAGIKLHAAGTVNLTKADDTDIHTKFDYLKRAGIGIMVAGDPTHDSLPIIEKYVKQYDIRVAIHNHGPEDKLYFPSPLDVLAAIKNMDPRIGCCIDLGHTMRTGTNVIEAIHKVGPRLFDLHIKDLADGTKKESQVAVGRGVMPVRGVFEALMAINYKGFVDLEYEINANDPMPGVIESFAYMRGVLAGMGHPESA